MAISIKEIHPHEFALNHNHPILPVKTLFLELGSSQLSNINRVLAEEYFLNYRETRDSKYTPGPELHVFGLICLMHPDDCEVIEFANQKELEWREAGYKIGFLPPKYKARGREVKKDPNLGDCLKRSKTPSTVYAYLGKNTIPGRITLADALTRYNLISRDGLFID